MAAKLSDYNKAFIIRRYTAIEAGYVNDPNDLGGETNHGITKALATEYKKDLTAKFGWDGTMKNLPKEAAFWLYDVEFWTKMRLDDVASIHVLLADKMFDIAINAGKTRSTKFLQEFLNVNNNQQKLYKDLVVDGGMGDTTVGTLKAYYAARGVQGLKIALFQLTCRQCSYYTDISMGREANERFTYGWTVRAYESMGEYQKLGFLFA